MTSCGQRCRRAPTPGWLAWREPAWTASPGETCTNFTIPSAVHTAPPPCLYAFSFRRFPCLAAVRAAALFRLLCVALAGSGPAPQASGPRARCNSSPFLFIVACGPALRAWWSSSHRWPRRRSSRKRRGRRPAAAAASLAACLRAATGTHTDSEGGVPVVARPLLGWLARGLGAGLSHFKPGMLCSVLPCTGGGNPAQGMNVHGLEQLRHACVKSEGSCSQWTTHMADAGLVAAAIDAQNSDRYAALFSSKGRKGLRALPSHAVPQSLSCTLPKLQLLVT